MDQSPASAAPQVPIESEDYYLEGPNLVFTAAYHLKRGSCCNSGCRHCPYGFVDGDAPAVPDPTVADPAVPGKDAAPTG